MQGGVVSGARGLRAAWRFAEAGGGSLLIDARALDALGVMLEHNGELDEAADLLAAEASRSVARGAGVGEGAAGRDRLAVAYAGSGQGSETSRLKSEISATLFKLSDH